MSNGWRWLERLIDATAELLAKISSLAVVVLTLVVTYGVVMRYLFGRPQNWTNEVASYTLVSLVFFGLAHTLYAGGHIRMVFLVGNLGPRIRAWFQLVAYLFGIAFTSLLFLGCYTRVASFIERHEQSIGTMNTPLYIPAIPLVVGSGVLLLMMVSKGIRHVVDMRSQDSSRPTPTEPGREPSP